MKPNLAGRLRRWLDDVAKEANGRDSIAVAVMKSGGVSADWVTTWTQELPPGGQIETLWSVATDAAASGFANSLPHSIAERFQPILDAVVDYLPSPADVPAVEGVDPKTGALLVREHDDNEPFSALAFKIQMDPQGVGKLTFFRVYSGRLKAGSGVLNATNGRKERIGRILRMHAIRREDVDEVFTGDIAAAVGLKYTTTGDTLCDPSHPIVLERMEFPAPVIAVAIEPKTKADQDKLGKALGALSEEDPTFQVRTDEDTGQTIISGMGELHLEIITDRLLREFKVEANVGRPQVLILDDPTPGLHPRLRPDLLSLIRDLVTQGTTVLLTTQYLEEADQLADQSAVVDHGRVIANGTADELKTQVGGERLELTVAQGGDLSAAMEAVRSFASGEIQVNTERRHLVVPVTQGAQLLAAVVRDLDAVHIPLDDLALRRPTLDDVFLALTGRSAEEVAPLADTLNTPPMVRSTR